VMHHNPIRVMEFLLSRYQGRYGIGDYQRWTHIDVRSTKARW
jgi:hypothetical protein